MSKLLCNLRDNLHGKHVQVRLKNDKLELVVVKTAVTCLTEHE
jgi:hypothetical protein